LIIKTEKLDRLEDVENRPTVLSHFEVDHVANTAEKGRGGKGAFLFEEGEACAKLKKNGRDDGQRRVVNLVDDEANIVRREGLAKETKSCRETIFRRNGVGLLKKIQRGVGNFLNGLIQTVNNRGHGTVQLFGVLQRVELDPHTDATFLVVQIILKLAQQGGLAALKNNQGKVTKTSEKKDQSGAARRINRTHLTLSVKDDIFLVLNIGQKLLQFKILPGKAWQTVMMLEVDRAQIVKLSFCKTREKKQVLIQRKTKTKTNWDWEEGKPQSRKN
jgi:hypothetical protein